MRGRTRLATLPQEGPPARAAPPGRKGYFYLRDPEAAAFVGHAHHRVDEAGIAHIGINVVPERRGAGVAGAGLRLLLARIWDATDARVVVNEFEEERTAAVRLHQRAGFVRAGITRDYGRPVTRWELSRPAGL